MNTERLKEYSRKYYQVYSRKYYQKNKERIATYMKEWKKKNPELRRKYNKNYDKRHPERRKNYNREYMKTFIKPYHIAHSIRHWANSSLNTHKKEDV